jgi:hypothetical protein
MAYNNRNKLIKVNEIICIYQDNKKLGYTNEHIYKNIIYPAYFISKTTFYNYLTIPANRLLKELEKQT